jgi:hypothetical protein
MAAGKKPRLRLLHMRDEIESLSNELAGLGVLAEAKSEVLERVKQRASSWMGGICLVGDFNDMAACWP